LAKGYTPAKIVDAAAPAPAAQVATVVKSSLHEIAKAQIARTSNNPVLDKLIERLVRANVHKITSSTNITLNNATGLFQTPLGIVTPDAITEARDLLADTLPFVKNGKYNKELERLVSQYLRLIPQNIGMRFNVQAILPDVTAVQKQGDILDALEASYAAITKPSAPTTVTDDKKAAVEKVFNVDLDVETGTDAARIQRWFETSKAAEHGYNRIRIINIFRVKLHDNATAFCSENDTEVFHGTSEANNLSILKVGLRVSPPATAAIAGKMWGNGVYGAKKSSKSLGYTYGKWGQSIGESGWLYVCQFAMGNIYYPNTGRYNPNFRVPTGHHSCWARAIDTGLCHDELIIYDNNRLLITHLIECK
jgi:poly [ADP-ribose] polymerase